MAVEALLRRDALLLQTILSPALAVGTRWIRFDCSQPGVIPADEGKAARDLEVYESALAIVDAGGKSGLVQIGELVKVGQVWKLTSIPVPLAGDTVQVTAGGVLLQPAAPSVAVATPGVTPKMQKLLDQLRDLDSSPPTAGTPAALSSYHSRRSDVLGGLSVAAAKKYTTLL